MVQQWDKKGGDTQRKTETQSHRSHSDGRAAVGRQNATVEGPRPLSRLCEATKC